MSIYGNKIFLSEKNDDEPNRGVTGHAYTNKNSHSNTKQKNDYNVQMALARSSESPGADTAKLVISGDIGTTSPGKDIIDSEMRSRIDSFDKKRAEEILKSKDIVTEYNTWIGGEVDQIIALAEKGEADENKGNIRYMLSCFSYCTEKGGLSKQEIKDYLLGNFFYTSDNPDNIKLLLNLRIHYCQHITKLLQQIARENYILLGYSKDELNTILENIGNNDPKTIQNIRKTIQSNINAFVRGNIVDLSSLHGGKVYLTDAEATDVMSATGTARGANNNSTQVIDELLQKSFQYKAIIQCHGGSASPETFFGEHKKVTDRKEAQSFVKLCRENGYTDDQINDYYNFNKNGNNEIWVMQKVSINGMPEQVVDWALAEIYLSSNKKENTILCAQCNPGGHKIHPVFHKIKGIKITYSDYSNSYESALTFDSVETAINEAEDDLRFFSDMYGIDYDSINIDEINIDDFSSIEEISDNLNEFDRLYEQVLNEGKFTDAIKQFAKKAVETVVALFKKLWEIVKKLFQKIKDFFTSKFKGNKNKISEPITVSMLVTESVGTKDYKISTPDELEKIALENIRKIETEISKRQKEQTDATNKLNEFVQKQAS